MRFAVLPFNAGPNSRPSLGRQFANFATEIARGLIAAKTPEGQDPVELDGMNVMARVEQDGVPRMALVNPAETLNDTKMITELAGEAELTGVIDGLLQENEGGGGTLTVRLFKGDYETPMRQEAFHYLPGGEFSAIRSLITLMAEAGGVPLPDNLNDDKELFGVEDPAAFLKFLEGYDALQYVERAQGMVLVEFKPQDSMNLLLEAIEADREWEAPFMVLTQFCRMCTMYRVGTADAILETLQKLTALEPEDGRGHFALGELYATVGDHAKAADSFETAHRLNPEEPAILTRLAISQMNTGMPVNAERNLRRAVELEGDDKPSLEILGQVLAQSGRAHEVPELWNDLIRKNEQDGRAHTQYAMALINAGRKEDGLKAFDKALLVLEDTTLIKRYYAPVLANEQDFDRAMDFYEDVLEEAQGDVQLMVEYAQVLQAAGRDVDIPDVLDDILAANPDANTRAQTLAWKTELEQPKRVEAVQGAAQKAEAGDFEGALRELRPLKNWLAQYWKMWVVMAGAQNQLGQHKDAEESARNLLELFPACEPGYVELNNALHGQGKDQEAYGIMRLAMGNIPNSLPIAISYGLATKRVGNKDEARALAKQIREAMGDQAQGLDAVLRELEN